MSARDMMMRIIRDEFIIAMQNDFIPRNSLKKIWTEERLLELVQLFEPSSSSDVSTIREGFIQTISILVEMDWDRWNQFPSIFLEPEGRTDKDIRQYTQSMLANRDFLGNAAHAKRFIRTRYDFCPVEIVEGMSAELSRDWKLPFLDEDFEDFMDSENPRLVGHGISGEVTRETVAPEHLHFNGSMPSSRKSYFACKRFRSQEDFAREKIILKVLRECLTKHEGIMPFFATIIIGHEFNLIFDYADMDLEKFLCQQTEEVDIRDLIKESRDLAGALAFLHGGMDQGYFICHRDLKPANILVFKSPGTPGVGKWKISDFGNSTIFSPEEGPQNTTGRKFTLPGMVIQKGTRTYQSPEATKGSGIGLATDVWSLGCILVRLIAFGIGGIDELRDLDTKRRQSAHGENETENECFHRGNPPIRNPHIETWMNELPERSTARLSLEARQRFLNLLRGTLEVNASDRLSAKEVQLELRNILNPRRSSGVSTESPPSTCPRDQMINQTRSAGNLEEDYESANRKHGQLIKCIREQNYELVDILLGTQKNLDIESRDSESNTLLYCAVDKGDIRIVDRLLQENVKIDGPSKGGVTPLMQATRKGNHDMVQLLLDHGADCGLYCNEGYTCLHYIAWAPTGGADLIRKFRGRGCFNVARHGTDERPLSTLIKNHRYNDEWKKTFNALIAERVDVNLEDRNKMTPLYHAVFKNLVDVTTTLLHERARLGSKKHYDDRSWSPSPEMRRLIEKHDQLQRPRPSRSAGSFLHRMPFVRMN